MSSDESKPQGIKEADRLKRLQRWIEVRAPSKLEVEDLLKDIDIEDTADMVMRLLGYIEFQK